MDTLKLFRSLVLGGASLALSACGTITNNNTGDSGVAGTMDAGPMDAGPLDAGETDAGDNDAGDLDAGPMDAGPVDAGDNDAGDSDAGPTDAGPVDAGHVTVPDAGMCRCTPDSDWPPANDCAQGLNTAVCCWLEPSAPCCPG